MCLVPRICKEWLLLHVWHRHSLTEMTCISIIHMSSQKHAESYHPILSCSLVPIPMWAHYVAHVAIYTPSHVIIREAMCNWLDFGWAYTDKLDWPDPTWPTFSYTMKLRAAYLKTEMKWRNERWMIPFFSFSSYSKWQVTCLVAVTDSWNNNSKLINGRPIK